MNEVVSDVSSQGREPCDIELEREVERRLQPLWTLSPNALLERLLGSDPEDPDESGAWVGYASPTKLT